MRTFEEIETKNRTTPVVSADTSFEGGGTLILDGPKTEAVLQCKEAFHPDTGDDGWFELRLRAPSGRPILLHNALLTQSKQHGFYGTGNHEAHIYANTVIIGSDALVDGQRVKQISFTFKEMNAFLHYQHVENHSLWKVDADVLDSLKKLRKKEHKYDRFSPREIFLAHTFPRVLDFKVGTLRYEIFVGSTQRGFGWHAIDYTTLPIASITFEEPVSIDDAIEAVWQWKQFFSLLALRPFALTSLTAVSGRGRKAREAEFYIPGHREDISDESKPWAGDLPLNRWAERHKLSRVMSEWISRRPLRQRLRGAVVNVSRDMEKRVSIDDVVTLCAGIESLTELNIAATLTSKEVAKLAEGAIDAAKEHGISADPQRIKTVLNFLRQQSLPQRLKLMMAGLIDVTEDQAKLLISATLELRTIAAHGTSISDSVLPKAAPTIEGLACACALYDLTTCGLPTTNTNGSIGILRRLQSAIFELQTIKAAAKKSV